MPTRAALEFFLHIVIELANYELSHAANDITIANISPGVAPLRRRLLHPAQEERSRVWRTNPDSAFTLVVTKRFVM